MEERSFAGNTACWTSGIGSDYSLQFLEKHIFIGIISYLIPRALNKFLTALA